MPRSGRHVRVSPGPAIVLVEPQLGENIGTAARAMANFGLSELRLVNPREGWPNEKARAAASRAGISLIFSGWSYVMMALMARQTL